jgi:hypothetical protein
MIGCDTSFLHSLYLIDSHTRKPRARVKLTRGPADRIALLPFHLYELPNAIRLSVFRGLRNVAAGEAILAAFRTDQDDGWFELHFGAREFLTFDAKQSNLALAVGLKPGP